jgi:hypothetical protein
MSIGRFKFAELADGGAGPNVFSRRYCWVTCMSDQRKASDCIILLPHSCAPESPVGSPNRQSAQGTTAYVMSVICVNQHKPVIANANST